MADKTLYSARLSAHITPAMNRHLDQLAAQRGVPKAELTREAVRFWLDHQADAHLSRQYFNKSLQRRLDYLDWGIEVLIQMLLALARKQPELLQEAIQAALRGELTERLMAGNARRAASKRQPPAE